MTKSTESDQTVGAGTETQDQVSQTDDKQSSSTTVTLETVLQKLVDLDKQVRGLQKVKDKGTNRLQKQVQAQAEQLKKVAAYIERYGSPEEAARQIALDGLLGDAGDDDDEPEVPASDDKSKSKQAASVDVDDELLTLLGIEPNDPELMRRIKDGMSQLDAAKAVANAKRSSQSSASAAALGPGGGGQAAETKMAALRSQYDEETAKLGRPAPIHQLEEIKRKYRKQGLDVW